MKIDINYINDYNSATPPSLLNHKNIPMYYHED